MIKREIGKKSLEHILKDFRQAQNKIDGKAPYIEPAVYSHLIDFINWWEFLNRRLSYLTPDDLARLNPELPKGWKFIMIPNLVNGAINELKL
jgi:hypothetical protein